MLVGMFGNFPPAPREDNFDTPNRFGDNTNEDAV
jgi:hypothetical protein